MSAAISSTDVECPMRHSSTTFPLPSIQAQTPMSGRSSTISTTVNSLPDELLLDIFRNIIPQQKRMKDLVRLSGVCRRWKSIIEDVSTLWSWIDGEDGLPFVQKSLQLSRDAPLDIKFETKSWEISRDDVDPALFLSEVLTSIARWKSLTLGIPATSSTPVFAVLRTASALNLEKLILIQKYRCWDLEPTDESLIILGEAGGLPRLEHLDISLTPIALAPLQLSGLKSLSLSNIKFVSADDILHVLQHSLELTVLSFNWRDDNDWPTVFEDQKLPASPSIELPMLHELRLMK
ncbi:hypothetical protein FRB90_005152, partial [Tulasnella sp. 427]